MLFSLNLNRHRCALIAVALSSLAYLISESRAQVTIADSVAEFSGVQGQDDWWHGYRNLTADGGAEDYDAVNDFIPFLTDGTTVGSPTNNWNGTAYDFFSAPGVTVNPPWTFLGAEGTHPNGTNQAEVHWTIRRWTAPASDLTEPTLLQIDWFIAKSNANTNGNGVTARLHHNGVTVGTTAIPGNGTTGLTRSTFIVVEAGDHLDLAHTAVGPDGSGHDGSDSSRTTMIISTVVDTDTDGLPDGWEESFFPGDLSQLASGQDYDIDGLNDEEELAAGTDPSNFDTDGDGLEDGWETNDGNFVSGTQTGTNPLVVDTDGDTLSDGEEINASPQTNPNLADTDGDGSNDNEELLFGSDPTDINDDPLSLALADSRTEFSGVDGQDGWRWGYRNHTVDGNGTDYDAANDFIAFPVNGTTTRSTTNFWNGNNYDWVNAVDPQNPPWTALAQETTHPNGTNNGDEHWTVRRWTASGLGAETPVRVIWHTRKTNLFNDGVTGSIHLNGTEVDTQTIAGNDGTGFVRFYYLHLVDGDIVDQVLTPQGVTNRSDGNDGSANWMRIDTRIPEIPIQPDGSYFIPNDAVDSEPDGLADFWEEVFFPGDLSQLAGGQDFDGDGLSDDAEQAASSDPTVADTDGDGLNDGREASLGTDPRKADSDADGFDDFHEVATGYDPLDEFSNVSDAFTALADSVDDFPTGNSDPQGLFGWTYGHYNVTQDGEPPANTNFIHFPTDDSTIRSAANHWDGDSFDWFNDPVNPPPANEHNPPWTQIAATDGHPNGDNNGDIHWAVRRWTVNIAEPAPLALHYHLRKTNPNGGNGTTAIILHNGRQLDRISVQFNDSVGLKSWYFIEAQPGDLVEIALSPEGPDGGNGDGADGSGFWLLVDPTIPANPLQPDGSPFGPSDEESRLLTIAYEQGLNQLTLSWTSKNDKEYQIEESIDLANWTPIGPTISPDSSGVTSYTLDGVGPAPRYFHVLELDP